MPVGSKEPPIQYAPGDRTKDDRGHHACRRGWWGIRAGFPARFGVGRFATQAFGGPAPSWWPNHALTVIAPDGVARTWTKEFAAYDPASLHADRIAVPVAIVHGSDDNVVPPRVADARHRDIRQSSLVMVAGGRHMLPNTHAERIVAEARELRAAQR